VINVITLSAVILSVAYYVTNQCKLAMYCVIQKAPFPPKNVVRYFQW